LAGAILFHARYGAKVNVAVTEWDRDNEEWDKDRGKEEG
jgi:hypothetical protein